MLPMVQIGSLSVTLFLHLSRRSTDFEREREMLRPSHTIESRPYSRPFCK